MNDVAAMKAADVSVSFLNGFGDEKSMAGGIDFDDERRRKKVQAQLLGSQRSKKHSERNIERKEDRERMNQQIQKMQAETDALQTGISTVATAVAAPIPRRNTF